MKLQQSILKLFVTLFFLKIVYILIITLAVYFFPSLDESVFNRVHQHWPRDGGPVFATHFATWDAAHYLYLSEEGYKTGMPSCAFYPLWPIMIKCGAIFFRGNHLISGIFLSNLFSIIGWCVFYKNTKVRFGERIAKSSLILLILFPGSLFYQFIYSESLFFLLLMLLWNGLEKKNIYLIFISSFLLPLTRAIGIFCLLPILYFLITQQNENLYKKINFIKFIKKLSPQLWLLFIPFLGWMSYFLFMRFNTGNAFEGFEAQKFWGVHSIWNIVNIPKFLMKFCEITNLHEFTGSVLDRIVFLFLFYSIPLISKLGKDMIIWVFVLGIIPALSGDLVSFTRFCSVIFPLFIGLASHFYSGSEKRIQLFIYLLVCVILHGFLLWRFINYHWAG